MKQFKTILIKDFAFNQNAYMVVNAANEAVIVDPGYGFKEIISKIDELQVKVVAIVLTHYHFDHVVGVDELCERYQVKAYIHVADKSFLLKDTLAVSMGFAPVTVKDENILAFEETLEIPGFDFKVKNLPGHSKGSCFIQIENDIFTGDTLFATAIGRTDIPGSEPKKMTTSIKWIKENLKDHDIINPGHGDSESFINVLKINKYIY